MASLVYIDHTKPRRKSSRKSLKTAKPPEYGRCDLHTCLLARQCLRYTEVPHPDDRQHWIKVQNPSLDCYMYDPDEKAIRQMKIEERKKKPTLSEDDVLDLGF